MSKDYETLKRMYRQQRMRSSQQGGGVSASAGGGAGQGSAAAGNTGGAGRAGTAGRRGTAGGPGRPAGPVALLVGLGNPGTEYARTRHNAGFLVVDALAQQLGASYWKSRPSALFCELSVAGPDAATRKLLLLKPTGYMNLSGGPVAALAKEYGISPGQILVVHDDLEVPAGSVRVRMGGGHAGHNGLRSICDKLGSKDFGRVRVGIGRPPGRMDPADFVLRQLRGSEADAFDALVSDAARAAHLALTGGLAAAQQRYA